MKASAKQQFEAPLTPRGPNGAWTHLLVPFNVEQTFGSKAMVKVAGTINGVPFRTSLMPNGDGTHYMAVTKEMMAQAKVSPRQIAAFTLELDTAPRTVEVPVDLAERLTGASRESFDRLAYSHRKEYVDWIEQAKRPETRARRIQATLERLAAKAGAGTR